MPMALGWGAGAELRKPLGIAIVGGLVVSQMLTLFTTPVIYLYLDRLRKRFALAAAELPATAPVCWCPAGVMESGDRDESRMRQTAVAALSLLLCGVHDRPAYQRPALPDAGGPQGNGRQRPVEDGDAERRPAQGQMVGDLRRSRS